MRKAITIFLLVTTVIFALSACGIGKPKIEDYEWKMRYVMHGEDNQAVIDAVAEESSAYPEASIIEMTLVAKDGKITVTDVTNNRTYEGAYTVSGRNPEGTDYHITIDGITGYACVAMTKYAYGTKEPTLPISLGNYSLYFYAE